MPTGSLYARPIGQLLYTNSNSSSSMVWARIKLHAKTNQIATGFKISIRWLHQIPLFKKNIWIFQCVSKSTDFRCCSSFCFDKLGIICWSSRTGHSDICSPRNIKRILLFYGMPCIIMIAIVYSRKFDKNVVLQKERKKERIQNKSIKLFYVNIYLRS